MTNMPGRTGRPTLEQAAVLKERILACALDMLCSRGISGLSMDGLADAAGVTKRTIYRHFENRIALIEAVLNREMERLGQAMDTPEGETSNPLGALKAWSRHFFCFILDPNTRRFKIFLSFEQLSDPELAAMLQNWIVKATEPVERLILSAQCKGQIRQGDHKQFTMLLMDLLHGTANRIDFNYPIDLITGGIPEIDFFAMRWTAFVQLVGPDPWQSRDHIAG